MSDRVLSAALSALRRRDALSDRRLERVTVGERAVLVELGAHDREFGGLAHRPGGSDGSVAATSLEGLLAPIGASAGSRLELAGGIAAMNALSAPFIEWRRGDPMERLPPGAETIVTVGLFRPALRKFGDVEVRVIEREARSVPDADVRLFTPDEAEAAMDRADVVFVTGSTLLYGGLERYIGAAPEAATVVVVGATASFVPEPLFSAGVDVVAGAAVTDPAGVRAAVRAGACGTDLHDSGVEKVYVERA
jgi:uncharacterized protein (DUF4213/DUF364 family)